jgi:hypothetical protein
MPSLSDSMTGPFYNPYVAPYCGERFYSIPSFAILKVVVASYFVIDANDVFSDLVFLVKFDNIDYDW